MSLADFEGIALSNNPSLAQMANRLEAARGEWVQVGLAPNPVLGYVGSEIGNDGRAGQQGGYIGQEIVTGGKLSLNRQVAAQEVRAAEERLAAQHFRVVSDVRIGFFDALVAERRVRIAEELVRVGVKGSETADEFFTRGEGNRVDFLQARVEASTARILLENAVNDHAAAWRRLTAICGTPDMAPVTLTGDLEAEMPEIVFEDALERLLSSSPELGAARAAVSRSRQVLRRAAAEPTPNIDLQAMVQHDNASSDDIAGVQVGFPIPLWNRNQGGIRRSQGELAAAQNAVAQLELSLKQRLASVYQQYANARQQVSTYEREILPDARSSLDLVTRGYQQGEFGYLMVLTSQRTFFQTNLAYLESLRQVQEATALIEGMLLTDSLNASE